MDILSTVRSTAKNNRITLVALVPLSAFLLIAVFLAFGLFNNPRLIPSPLIGQSIPDFLLPPVQGRKLGLASGDLRDGVSMVNVFASWCKACRQEHPLLMRLSRQGIVPIYGLNYKDKPQQAADWLDSLGDPYARTGADIEGLVGIDWGVYGVPETFIIDKLGRIAYKHIGPIMKKDWHDTLLPLIKELHKEK